jgi:predicted transcriptional regulator
MEGKRKYIIVPMYIRGKDGELLSLLDKLGTQLNRSRSDVLRIALNDLLTKHGIRDEQTDSSQ